MRALMAVAACTLVYALVAVWEAPRLPADGIPLHFDGSGEADRFGTRGEAVALWTWLGIGAFGFALLVILLVRHAPLGIMNVPHKTYWSAPHREPVLRRMLETDMAVFLSATILFLAMVPVWTVLAVRAGGDLPAAVFWAPLALFLVALGAWTVWVHARRYRPRPDA